MHRAVAGLALVSVIATTGIARANPEPPAVYDARITAMAGAAVASVDSAAALLHNPAQLDLVDRVSVTLSLTPLIVTLRAPFAGPGSEQSSGPIFAPMMFAGGAARVHERVTVGLGAYLLTGFGGGFDAVGCFSYGDASRCGTSDPNAFTPPTPLEQRVTLFIAELAVPVQVTLIPGVLSAGVSLRLPYGQQAVDAVQQEPAFGQWSQASQRLAGFGIPGVTVGVSVRPIPNLTLSATYRSKVWVDMAGTTEIPTASGVAEIGTTSRWYVPHAIRLGAALTTAADRLTISLELRTQLHAEANRTQRFELDTAGDPFLGTVLRETTAEFRWRNVYIAALGAELRPIPRLALRAGASIGQSASNPDTLTAFSPPPGLQIAAYGGLGVRVGDFDIDFAAGWGGGPPPQRSENDPALCTPASDRYDADALALTASGGCAGKYRVDSIFLALSATLRL